MGFEYTSFVSEPQLHLGIVVFLEPGGLGLSNSLRQAGFWQMYRSVLGASGSTFPSGAGESNPGEVPWDSRISGVP